MYSLLRVTKTGWICYTRVEKTVVTIKTLNIRLDMLASVALLPGDW